VEGTKEEEADLSPYPTSVAARLSAHCAFSFGRPGFLGDFSGGRSGGRRYVTTNRRIVRHLGVSLRETEGERERKQTRIIRGEEERTQRRKRRGWENRRREKPAGSLCVSDREGEKGKEKSNR
jgi:hypothetical protein